jgi:hypothetical protein
VQNIITIQCHSLPTSGCKKPAQVITAMNKIKAHAPNNQIFRELCVKIEDF